MYPVSPGWRWRPISRTRRGVAHLCTFPPSGEVLLPNCPPPVGGLDIRWWKSCLFECALPGGTVRRPFHRGGVCPCAAIYRGEVPAGAGHLPEAYTRLALAIYRKPVTGAVGTRRGRYPAKAMVIRAPARPHGRHHGKHGDEACVVVPGRSDLRGKHHIFKMIFIMAP